MPDEHDSSVVADSHGVVLSAGPPFADPRIEEYTLLAGIYRDSIASFPAPRPLHLPAGTDLPLVVKMRLAHLISEGYLVGTWWWENRPSQDVNTTALRNQTSTQIEGEKWWLLTSLLYGGKLELVLSYKGLLRMAEIEQVIKANRDKDPTGLLISMRHWEKDLRIALQKASKQAPVVVAMVDMNGMKAINDQAGHQAGDEAIRLYLQTLSEHLGGGIDAYRGDASDEVRLVSWQLDLNQIRERLRSGFAAMAKVKVELKGKVVAEGLFASAGLVVLAEPPKAPQEAVEVADSRMYKAKKFRARNSQSALCFGDSDSELEVLP